MTPIAHHTAVDQNELEASGTDARLCLLEVFIVVRATNGATSSSSSSVSLSRARLARAAHDMLYRTVASPYTKYSTKYHTAHANLLQYHTHCGTQKNSCATLYNSTV